jgi:hypothetical protein
LRPTDTNDLTMHTSLSLLLVALAAASNPCPAPAELLAPLVVQEDEPPAPPAPPTEEQVKAAVAKLRAVLANGAFDEKVAALTEAESCLHADVVALIAGALRDDAAEVRVAAAESLGRMDLDAALDALHAAVKRRATVEEEALAVALFKSIGRHADPASIDILEDNALGSPDKVAQARILALGRIRDIESVEALMGLMNKLRVAKGAGSKQMQELRLALHVLTGVDQGADRRDWQRWWNDTKRTLEIAAEVPELDRKLERLWDEFWGERERAPRGEREERDEPPTPEPAPEPQPGPEPQPQPAPEPTPPPAPEPTPPGGGATRG